MLGNSKRKNLGRFVGYISNIAVLLCWIFLSFDSSFQFFGLVCATPYMDIMIGPPEPRKYVDQKWGISHSKIQIVVEIGNKTTSYRCVQAYWTQQVRKKRHVPIFITQRKYTPQKQCIPHAAASICNIVAHASKSRRKLTENGFAYSQKFLLH